MDSKRLNVILDDNTIALLDAWCLDKGLSRSAGIRLILKQFLGEGVQLKIK